MVGKERGFGGGLIHSGEVCEAGDKVMSSAVQDVKDLIDHLPDDASIEDIQYHLYVLEKIRRGQADIRDGKHFSSEEARERLSKWLNP